MLARKTFVIAIAAVLLLTSISGGCSAKKFAPPPYIPSGYYDCIETYPAALVSAYFSGYGEIWGPMENYNDKIFVFKNVLVDQWMLRELDNGWLWLDLIRCQIANIEVMDHYKLGDRIDVVGFNLGPEDIGKAGLTFKDCYILPPGVLVLPAEGNGSFDGGY